jgi:hypothetical protein
MWNPEALARYEATTPVLPDMLYDYNDAVEFNYRSYATSNFADQGGTVRSIPYAVAPGADIMGSTSYHLNVLGTAMDSHFNGLKGRGCHQLKSITKQTNGNTEQYTVVINVTEPFLMSPWIFRGLVQNSIRLVRGLGDMLTGKLYPIHLMQVVQLQTLID